ncbi:MAG TPA: hypothetical protein PLV68_20910, partial [Ilumatobacteraceae bacterium]|nr:hypothetical protein [Ilumatobacteraceae bacterium]
MNSDDPTNGQPKDVGVGPIAGGNGSLHIGALGTMADADQLARDAEWLDATTRAHAGSALAAGSTRDDAS